MDSFDTCKISVLIYIILPIRSLSPLDIEVMKRLGSRVNLIPVIAKADTLTPNDLAAFKKRVRLALMNRI